MRFHVLGVPHTITHPDWSGCAFTQKVAKFLKMMSARGHTLIHYGHADSQVPQNVEHVTVTNTALFEHVYGTEYTEQQAWKTKGFAHYYDVNDQVHRIYWNNAIAEIEKRKQPNDFILHFWGVGTKPVADAHPDLINVEPGIGNGNGFARWRVYESNSVRSAVEGVDSVNYCRQDWYHVTIPNSFDLDDFDYRSNKQDYVLYLGRIGYNKGVDIVIEATKAAGKRLKIAGQGTLADLGYTSTPDHVELVGYADPLHRRFLMANAESLFIGSRYSEPFGGVTIEAALSGTPSITPDWGCFPETIVQGRTGFRCRTFSDFVTALKEAPTLNSLQCRLHGEQYSLENTAPKYERYFQDVLNTYTAQGWYTL
jgi:glycosyltransferase involved in cell wall biosynthesis